MLIGAMDCGQLQAGVREIGQLSPDTIKGYKQQPIEGTSLYYSINDASAPDRHTVQYFELRGKRNGVDEQERVLIDEWEAIYAALYVESPARSFERLEAFLKRYPGDGVARYHASRMKVSD